MLQDVKYDKELYGVEFSQEHIVENGYGSYSFFKKYNNGLWRSTKTGMFDSNNLIYGIEIFSNNMDNNSVKVVYENGIPLYSLSYTGTVVEVQSNYEDIYRVVLYSEGDFDEVGRLNGFGMTYRNENCGNPDPQHSEIGVYIGQYVDGFIVNGKHFDKSMNLLYDGRFRKKIFTFDFGRPIRSN